LETLHLVIAEAALELVPKVIQGHPAVRRHASKLGKRPGEILLDRSHHHWAMRDLPDSLKRGRPDIVHFILLEALGSPLNMMGRLRTWVATYDDQVLELSPRTRLPRVYERFKGLVEKLYVDGEVRTESGERLMALRHMTLQSLVAEIKPDKIILLSEKGERLSLRALAGELHKNSEPMAIIGGFPHSGFRPETMALADKIVSIFEAPLEAWVAASRLLCAVEEMLKGDIGPSPTL